MFGWLSVLVRSKYSVIVHLTQGVEGFKMAGCEGILRLSCWLSPPSQGDF